MASFVFDASPWNHDKGVGCRMAAFRWQRLEIGPSGIGPISVIHDQGVPDDLRLHRRYLKASN